jgi:hypothetical protein
MKAEHRKELQTNALADRMGRMVQRIKTPPNRRSVLWMVVVLVVVVAGLVFLWRWNSKRSLMSSLWVETDQARLLLLTRDNRVVQSELLTDYATTKPGVAARFQFAYTMLWDRGVKLLAGQPTLALKSINNAERQFKELHEECKDDPVLGPEAAYALAVIEEARAVEDRNNLDKAKQAYQDVANRYKASAAGRAAGERAKYLEDNAIQIGEFYASLQNAVGLFHSLEKGKLEPPPKTPTPEKK